MLSEAELHPTVLNMSRAVAPAPSEARLPTGLCAATALPLRSPSPLSGTFPLYPAEPPGLGLPLLRRRSEGRQPEPRYGPAGAAGTGWEVELAGAAAEASEPLPGEGEPDPHRALGPGWFEMLIAVGREIIGVVIQRSVRGGWCHCPGSVTDLKGAFLTRIVLIMVNRGTWATVAELPVGLPHSSRVGVLALYFCGCGTEVLGVKLCLGEQRGTKDCTEEHLEDPCLSQGIFSAPAESHRIFGITQHLKGSLTAFYAILK